MFSFFVKDEFKGFWANEPNEEFIEATIRQMKWDRNSVTVVYHKDAKKLDEFEIGADLKIRHNKKLNELRIKEYEEDESGQPIIDEAASTKDEIKYKKLKEPIEIPAEYEAGEWIEPVVFFSKGIRLKK